MEFVAAHFAVERGQKERGFCNKWLKRKPDNF